VISVAAVLLLANLVDLTAIASLGSAVALAIFLITSIAAYRLRAETSSRASLLMAGILLTVVVLPVFAVQTLRTEPLTFVAIIAILGLAIVLDLIWSRMVRVARQSAGDTAARMTGLVKASHWRIQATDAATSSCRGAVSIEQPVVGSGDPRRCDRSSG